MLIQIPACGRILDLLCEPCGPLYYKYAGSSFLRRCFSLQRSPLTFVSPLKGRGNSPLPARGERVGVRGLTWMLSISIIEGRHFGCDLRTALCPLCFSVCHPKKPMPDSLPLKVVLHTIPFLA
jgi:hypothetical protein